MKVEIDRWEDGKDVRKVLYGLDRWEAHAAHAVRVEAAGCTVTVDRRHVPVDTPFGSEQQDISSWKGCRLVELGSGVGLLAIFLAKLGAQVVLTDQASVIPLLSSNVAANSSDCSSIAGRAQLVKLDWDEPEDISAVLAAVGGQVDMVLAADCCYVDEGGRSAYAETIICCCANLSTSVNTCCLIAFENRSEVLLRDLRSAASCHFATAAARPSPTTSSSQDRGPQMWVDQRRACQVKNSASSIPSHCPSPSSIQQAAA
ncbi:hypothetical protein WJX84_008065 [Apatococcus fuscideae]|uniref:Uncharacterized protein n=1 Tax=Apatococcus fuscideae TaxID=2026836 RepID=A0AAW1TGW7_9CHLO